MGVEGMDRDRWPLAPSHRPLTVVSMSDTARRDLSKATLERPPAKVSTHEQEHTADANALLLDKSRER